MVDGLLMPAPQVIERRALGLFTDPAPSTAPDGSLFAAENVWIRRPGMIEPRPGLCAESIATLSVPSGYSIYQAFPFESDIVVVATDGSGNWRVYSVTAGTTHSRFGTSTTAWTGTVGCVHAAQMAGNLYLTTDNGVFRITSPSTAAAYRAGLERPTQIALTTSTSSTLYPNRPLAANSAIAYRFCQARKVGDRWIRSAPSGRMVARSYTGSSAKAVVMGAGNVLSGSTAVGDSLSGDHLEAYRSVAFTTDDPDEPSDEMAYLASVRFNSGWDTFYDDTTALGLVGPALYTNSTQAVGGQLQENGRPPLCRDIAEYNGMMFFGAAVWPATLTFDILQMGPAWRDSSASTTDRFTTFTITGDTHSSTTVDNVSAADIAKLSVGMRVFLDGGTPNVADAKFADGTLITAIGGTSFTISAAALATTAGVTIRVCDWIELSINNGTTYTQRLYCHTANGSASSDDYFDCREFRASTSADVNGAVAFAENASLYFANNAAEEVMIVSVFGDGVYSPWSIHCEQIGVISRTSPATITAKTSKPLVTSPRIDTTGIASTTRGGVNFLAYSKLGEPEHVPPTNYIEIGSNEHAIQRVIQGRDCLFVFKTDGAWKVSGYSPETLQVDEYDRSMTLVHPDAVCAYDGRVAAWTNKGVVMMTDSGYEIISAPIATTIASAALSAASAQTTRGYFMAAWPAEDVVILGAGSGTLYAFHVRNQSWTKWTHATTTAHCASQSGTSLYVGGINSSTATLLKSNSTTKDIEYSITVASVTGTSVTINAGSGWTPAVNDCVVKGGTPYSITAVASSTAFTVHTTGLTTGSATAEVGPTCTLTFVGEDAGSPLTQKMWREVAWQFFILRGAGRIGATFLTDRYLSTTTTNYLETFQLSNFTPKSLRFPVPRAHKRSPALLPGLSISGPRMAWLLMAMALTFNPMSERLGNDD
jgi:hypothetical protein